MAPHRTVPPDDELLAEAQNHTVQADIARALKFNSSSLTNHLSKNPELKRQIQEILRANRDAEAVKNSDELTFTREVPAAETVDLDPGSDQVRAFMVERGIPLDEWVPVNVQARRYPLQLGDGVVEDAQYLSVSCKRKTGMTVLNVVPAPPARKVKPLKPRKGEPEIVALISCDQAPFHDEHAHELLCGWLEMVQPHRVVHLGDLVDYPSVSKYKDQPAFRASVQDCHVVAHRLLNERIRASPGTRWSLLPGNHDHRLPDYLRAGSKEIADLAPVGETDPWWHLRRMLHLDALGVEYVDPVAGMWERAQVQLAPALVARHGWRTGKAVAARDTARELGVSTVVGHTHRQCIAPVTVGRDGVDHLLWAMEVGCLCQTSEGLGYVPGIADWQQGWGVMSVWPDGTFTPELVQVVDGALRWRGGRYSPRHLKAA